MKFRATRKLVIEYEAELAEFTKCFSNKTLTAENCRQVDLIGAKAEPDTFFTIIKGDKVVSDEVDIQIIES
jgi:hypothetical protein